MKSVQAISFQLVALLGQNIETGQNKLAPAASMAMVLVNRAEIGHGRTLSEADVINARFDSAEDLRDWAKLFNETADNMDRLVSPLCVPPETINLHQALDIADSINRLEDEKANLPNFGEKQGEIITSINHLIARLLSGGWDPVEVCARVRGTVTVTKWVIEEGDGEFLILKGNEDDTRSDAILTLLGEEPEEGAAVKALETFEMPMLEFRKLGEFQG